MLQKRRVLTALRSGLIFTLARGWLVALGMLGVIWAVTAPLAWLLFTYLARLMPTASPSAQWTPLDLGLLHDLSLPWQQPGMQPVAQIVFLLPLLLLGLIWPALQAGLAGWSGLLPLRRQLDIGKPWGGMLAFWQGVKEGSRTAFLLAMPTGLFWFCWLQGYSKGQKIIESLTTPEWSVMMAKLSLALVLALISVCFGLFIDLLLGCIHLGWLKALQIASKTILKNFLSLVSLRLASTSLAGAVSMILLWGLYLWHVQGWAGVAGALLLQQGLTLTLVLERMLALASLRQYLHSG